MAKNNHKKDLSLEEVLDKLQMPKRMKPLLMNAYECITNDMEWQRPFGNMVQVCYAPYSCAYQNERNLFGTEYEVHPECRYRQVRTVIDEFLETHEE